METLKSLLSPENYQLIIAVVTAVGAAIVSLCKLVGALSMLVVALKKLLVPLKRYAESTATQKDNAAVEFISICLAGSAVFLEKAKDWLELAALNRLTGEQVVKVEKS